MRPQRGHGAGSHPLEEETKYSGCQESFAHFMRGSPCAGRGPPGPEAQGRRAKAPATVPLNPLSVADGFAHASHQADELVTQRPFSREQVPVQAAVLDRFGQVGGGHVRRLLQIRDRGTFRTPTRRCPTRREPLKTAYSFLGLRPRCFADRRLPFRSFAPVSFFGEGRATFRDSPRNKCLTILSSTNSVHTKCMSSAKVAQLSPRRK